MCSRDHLFVNLISGKLEDSTRSLRTFYYLQRSLPRAFLDLPRNTLCALMNLSWNSIGLSHHLFLLWIQPQPPSAPQLELLSLLGLFQPNNSHCLYRPGRAAPGLSCSDGAGEPLTDPGKLWGWERVLLLVRVHWGRARWLGFWRVTDSEQLPKP